MAEDDGIRSENIRAAGAICGAWLLEQTRILEVADRIVELFREGMLPLGRGHAGDLLDRYYQRAGERLSQAERRSLYVRVLGAGGSGDVAANRDFADLWLRLVSSVSDYARQRQVGGLLQRVQVLIAGAHVRTAARDLARNLSLHGYGMAAAAARLQDQLDETRQLIGNDEILAAFGSHDMWAVIDRVNASYLGGARNTERYRTQAEAGANIVDWVSKNHDRLRWPRPCRLVLGPGDSGLIEACERWLAAEQK